MENKMPEPNYYDCAKYKDHVISGRSNIKEACTKRWVENCPDFINLEEVKVDTELERITCLLINIQAYYNASKQVGHTETLKRGLLSRPDAVVLIACGNDQTRMQHQNCITLHQMAVRPYVDYARPLVIDNAAVNQMCNMASNAILKLQNENSMLKAQNNMLKMMRPKIKD